SEPYFDESQLRHFGCRMGLDVLTPIQSLAAVLMSSTLSERGPFSTGSTAAMSTAPEAAPSSRKRRALTSTRDSSEPTALLKASTVRVRLRPRSSQWPPRSAMRL